MTFPFSRIAGSAVLTTVLLLSAQPGLARTAAEGSMPLSDILRLVEANATRTVYSAEAHRSRWEVVSCEGRSRICREDVLDANSGAVRTSEPDVVWSLPPRDALPASEIVAKIEAMNIGKITEMDFDSRRWDIDIRSSFGSRAELKVDPLTGAIQRCEGRACP